MFIDILAIIAGLGLLVWGADRFVAGAAATARSLGVSPLMVGITIVGFGTSAPEMMISAFSAWQGNPGLAVGNAIGSNIANVGLILGATALVMPLAVHSRILRRELPVLLGAMAVVLLMFLDGMLVRWEGLVLMVAMVAVMGWVIWTARRSREADPLADEFAGEMPADASMGHALGQLTVGLLVLLASSRLLVWGAVNIAEGLGVSDLVIGLTIVAIGTSLPELAASIAGALKDEPDIAVGNIIGSNIFNTLAVLGLAGIIHPTPIAREVLVRDYPIMLAFSLALFVLAWDWRNTGGHINRIEGAALLMAFVAYQVMLYFSAAG